MLLIAYSLCLIAALCDEMNISVKIVRMFMFLVNLVIFDLIYKVILPLAVLFNLKNKMPDFFQRKVKISTKIPFTLKQNILPFPEQNAKNGISTVSKPFCFVKTEQPAKKATEQIEFTNIFSKDHCKIVMPPVEIL